MKEEDFYLIPYRGDSTEVVPQAEDLAPCTVVLSRGTVRKCLEQLRATIQRVPGLRIVIQGESDEADQAEMLAMGVAGFLRRDTSPTEAHKALKAVSNGEIWASRKTVSTVLRKLVFQTNAKDLSPRELEILRHITKGDKNREIADRLCISRDTVRWHIRSLYTKIGASDRLSAVMYGRRFLIEDSSSET